MAKGDGTAQRCRLAKSEGRTRLLQVQTFFSGRAGRNDHCDRRHLPCVGLKYTQYQGGKTVTLKGYYASEEGAALGGCKVGDKFTFSFPATQEGVRDFLKGLK